ncbi:unnamed protein product [Oikopleura dioica]|uniref:Mediator of RNA polymerase II transcription subunit 8 n=1 Tax=Oikopleura dioica TaxID=34765 RepID=E4YUP4_OIKDI|nr:unnamed protein product [Oikopleura dioica]
MSFNQASTNLIEKQLDHAILTVYNRSKDLKIALEGLLGKLDSELAQGREPNWASLLDSYALITGQIETLTRYLRSESAPRLVNTSCFPVILNPHRDEIVARLTEERVPSVNHEVVPDYFRTKPDPAVEALQKELNKDNSTIDAEKIKQVNDLVNKLADKIEVSLDSKRHNLENRRYNEDDDTNSLIGTYYYGIGLTNVTSGARNPPVTQQRPAGNAIRPQQATKQW